MTPFAFKPNHSAIAATFVLIAGMISIMHISEVAAQSRPAFLGDDVSYLWPTNASRYMSSSFGETRAAHFHAAMDIGTWGHEGYSVFASRDGVVQRVGVGPTGYGNVIYLLHDDGSISLYAHLKDFHPRIRTVVDSIRLVDYSFDFNRNMEEFNIRFQRGQQIGWTGSTGVGPPHLHFELRTPEGRPFNPLLAGVHIDDTIPPQFSGIAIEPLGANSLVNGSPRIHRSRPARRGGQYHFGTLRVQGEVGVAVNVFDRANASNNVHAVYELKMYVNDELYFHSRADSFSYSESRQMFLDRVYPILRSERRGYQRLYVRNANTLPFYQYSKQTGRLDLPPGEFAVRIIAADFFGNRSQANFSLVVTEPGIAEFTEFISFPRGYIDSRVRVRDDQIRNHVNTRGRISESGSESGSGTRTESGTGSGYPSGSSMVSETRTGSDLDSKPDRRSMPGQSTYIDDISSSSVYHPEHPPAGVIWHKNWVRPDPQTAIDGLTEWSIRPLGSFRDEMRRISSSSVGLPLDLSDRLELRQGNHAWVLHRIRPEHPLTIYHDDMRISINFPLNTFFEPVSIGIAGSYPEFTLFPDIEPFRRPATVRILLEEELQDRSGIGLYRVNSANGNLSHVASRVDETKSWISGTISSGGRYTLAYDTLAPDISDPSIDRWRHINQHYVTVHVEDDRSGIDYRSAEFFVNGQRGIAEYDPEKKLLRYHHPGFIPLRVNEIRVILSDRAGNTAEKIFTDVRYN